MCHYFMNNEEMHDSGKLYRVTVGQEHCVLKQLGRVLFLVFRQILCFSLVL